MIKVKHWRQKSGNMGQPASYLDFGWCDAWLVSCQHDAMNSLYLVLALEDNPTARDAEVGLKLFAERTLSNVRIPRHKIGLFDDVKPPLPDGAKMPAAFTATVKNAPHKDFCTPDRCYCGPQ